MANKPRQRVRPTLKKTALKEAADPALSVPVTEPDTQIVPAELQGSRQLLANTTPENQVEALKALADWSKWLITVETAVVTAVISLEAINSAGILLWVSIAAMFISIISATMLMGAIPNAIQNVHEGDRTSIYDFVHYGDLNWLPKFKLQTLAALQHAGAVVAAVGIFLHFAFGA